MALLADPLLAHQGGWDELLLTVGLVLGMLGVLRLRRRAARTPDQTAPPPAARGRTCSYCSATLTADAVRCPSCGFRIPRPQEP